MEDEGGGGGGMIGDTGGKKLCAPKRASGGNGKHLGTGKEEGKVARKICRAPVMLRTLFKRLFCGAGATGCLLLKADFWNAVNREGERGGHPGRGRLGGKKEKGALFDVNWELARLGGLSLIEKNGGNIHQRDQRHE